MNRVHKPDPSLYILLTHRRIPVLAILNARPARFDILNTLDKYIFKFLQFCFLSFSRVFRSFTSARCRMTLTFPSFFFKTEAISANSNPYINRRMTTCCSPSPSCKIARRNRCCSKLASAVRSGLNDESSARASASRYALSFLAR